MVTSVLLPLVVYYQLKLYIATISLERLQAFHTYHSVSMELLWDRTKPMITLVWLNTSLRHLQNIYLSTYQLLNLISQFPTKCSSFTSTISLRGHNTTALSRYKSVFLFWKWVQKPTYKICPSVRRVSGRNEKLSVSRVVPFVVIRIYFTLVSSTTINVKISILMHWVFQFLFFVCGFKW